MPAAEPTAHHVLPVPDLAWPQVRAGEDTARGKSRTEIASDRKNMREIIRNFSNDYTVNLLDV